MQNLRWTRLVYLEYFAVVLHTLRLQLEQNMVTRILRFVATLTQAAEEAQETQRSRRASQEHSFARPGAARQASTESSTTRVAARPGGSSTEVGEVPLELYFKDFQLHPVCVRVTVQIEPLCDDAALQPYHPLNQLAGLAQRLVSLSNSSLQLSALLLFDTLFTSVDSLVERIVWHYTLQVVSSVYKLIGSLDIIGNPVALFADVSGGVEQFFYEPRKGLVQSPEAFAQGVARGTAGLAGGVVGGTAGAFLGVASALTRGVGQVADSLVYDSNYQLRQKMTRQTRVDTTSRGVSVGLKALGQGFKDGAKGVIFKPVSGALDQGARGFFKGIGHGLVGAVAKPLSGFATLASKTTEGMASDARRKFIRSHKFSQLRVRQPRLMAPGMPLLPYPRVLPSIEEADEGPSSSSPNATPGPTPMTSTRTGQASSLESLDSWQQSQQRPLGLLREHSDALMGLGTRLRSQKAPLSRKHRANH